MTVVLREIQDNGYTKFWGVNTVHYGLWRENGELANIKRSVSSLQYVIDKSKQKLKPYSHQSWNIFKNCLVKQGLKLFSL